MVSIYESRNFLILQDDNNQATHMSRKVLRSPLGLARDIITTLFEESVDKLVFSLDDIKGFSAGITSSKRFKTYPLALYYPTYFAYQQYFHSSFRARQGKTLEEIVLEILKTHFNCFDYEGSVTERIKLMENIVGIKTKNDMDAVGWNPEKNKLVLIQIRSRDDTGGTTAKASLIDYAREMLQLYNDKKLPKFENLDILYIVAIWDDGRTYQRQALLTKCYKALTKYIPDTITSDIFVNEVPNGLHLDGKLILKMTYGHKELVKSLCEWFDKDYDSVSSVVSDTIHNIENWDDLWLSYLIANLELEQEKLTGCNNIKILDKLMKENNIKFNFKNYESLTESIDNATNILISKWDDASIPLNSPAQQAYYIRDLLFLKACYLKIKGMTSTLQ